MCLNVWVRSDFKFNRLRLGCERRARRGANAPGGFQQRALRRAPARAPRYEPPAALTREALGLGGELRDEHRRVVARRLGAAHAARRRAVELLLHDEVDRRQLAALFLFEFRISNLNMCGVWRWRKWNGGCIDFIVLLWFDLGTVS